MAGKRWRCRLRARSGGCVRSGRSFKGEFGPIDVLVANAGIGATSDAASLKASEVADVIGVNVIGVANCVAAVAPEMAARGSGQLVVISSLAAYRGLAEISRVLCQQGSGIQSL